LPPLKGDPFAELIRAGVDVVLGRGASILPFERNSPVRAPSLSEKESELLLAINRSLPAATTQRYQELMARRRAETLSPMEHQELLDLTDEVKQLQAESCHRSLVWSRFDPTSGSIVEQRSRGGPRVPLGDRSRTWFPAMIEQLRQSWRGDLSMTELIALAHKLDGMLHHIRTKRGIRPTAHNPMSRVRKTFL